MWGNTVMNSLLYVSSAAVFSKTSHFITRNPSYLLGFSSYVSLSLKRRINYAGIQAINLDVMLNRFCCNSYSSAAPRRTRSKKLKEADPQLLVMEKEKDAFYVVRKGDIIGVYRTLADCQAQVGTSVCDPSVSVFKGYSLPKETTEYLSSRGFQNALYTVNAIDVNADLFGELVPCPFQQPPLEKVLTSKRSGEVLGSSINSQPPLEKVPLSKRSGEVLGSSIHFKPLDLTTPSKHIKLDPSVTCSKTASCILEFDGASKGNPGPAGAGAILRTEDGRLLCRLREGVGIATNNVAEYRAMILGVKHALEKGFTKISVQGDSKLVCMQVQGLWKTKNDNMTTLCKEAKELKNKFNSFQIRHVLREFNSEADNEANKAVHLHDGEVEEDCEI